MIGLPTVVMVFLYRHRHRLESSRVVKFRYGLFYSGFRSERWYWECVVCCRKVALLAVGMFGFSGGLQLQANWGLLILIAAIFVQLIGAPYAGETSAKKLRILEIASLSVCWFTMWTADFFALGAGDLTFLTAFLLILHTCMLIAFVVSIAREHAKDLKLGFDFRSLPFWKHRSSKWKRRSGDPIHHSPAKEGPCMEENPLRRGGTSNAGFNGNREEPPPSLGGRTLSLNLRRNGNVLETSSDNLPPPQDNSPDQQSSQPTADSEHADADAARDWRKAWSPQDGCFYYYNETTGETLWDAPSCNRAL